MKVLKKIGKGLVVFLAIAHIGLWVTGNTHLYKALSDTYLQGRSQPGVDVPDIFPTRELVKGETKSWFISNSLNQTALSETMNSTNSKLNTLAYLVIHKDSIVHESYFDGYDKNSISNSFSMAKTILSVLTGIAVSEGKLSVDDPVNKYLPEFIPENDSSLTVKHLLTMTSGMNFRESYGNPFGFMAKAYYGTNLKELTAGYHLEKEPGTEHSYLGGNNLLLSFLLEKATGMKVSDYASKNLWNKLGMENNGKWILDHEDGDEKTFSGVYATARDYAKIGELYMNSGNAYGEQLIDSSYVANSTKPVNVLDTEGRITNYYGYAWWLLEHKGLKVFYMRGILGQYVLCVPEKDLIVVRLGRFRSEVKSDGVTPDDVLVYLEEGLKIIE